MLLRAGVIQDHRGVGHVLYSIHKATLSILWDPVDARFDWGLRPDIITDFTKQGIRGERKSPWIWMSP